jgi:hypothetical protein
MNKAIFATCGAQNCRIVPQMSSGMSGADQPCLGTITGNPEVNFPIADDLLGDLQIPIAGLSRL